MASEVIMPQMGESIAEGTITRWLVDVGESVERDQPILEISTDKVDAEIPAPVAGVLIEITHQAGETVPVNEVLGLIGEPGETVGADSAAAPQVTAPEPVSPRTEMAGEAPASEESRVEAKQLLEADQQTRANPSAQPRSGNDPAAEPDLAERVRKFSSPVVRKMAAEEGIDISKIEGSGIHGRVTKKDLVAYMEGDRSSIPATVEAAPARSTEVVEAAPREPGGFFVPAFSEGERVEIEPMSKIRQITAAHMVYSKATSAHVSTVFHMDLSKVVRARARAKEGFLKAHGTKLTYMPFIFKAVANALVANPQLNAAISGTDIVYKKDINIGMAVALDWGLIVPVIRNADGLNLVGLAKSANDLADRARSKRLSPDEVRGGTFTVTNPGVFGSLFGMPIINQPQVGILGIGTIEKRPVVAVDSEGNDTIAIKSMSYFAITFDHRLVDGSDADRFMNDVKRTLAEENWSELDPYS